MSPKGLHRYLIYLFFYSILLKTGSEQINSKYNCLYSVDTISEARKSKILIQSF